MADKTALAEHFFEVLPEAAARIIEAHPPAEVSAFVDSIPDALSGKALASMLPYHAARCLEGLSIDAAARYLRTLTTHRITAILRHLSPERRRPMLSALPRGLATRVGLLLNYSVRSVGAWMDPSPPAVSTSLAAADAMARLSDQDGRRSPDIFAIDDEERPKGVLTLADLVWATADAPVSGLANPIGYRLVAASTLATAAQHIGWSGADRLPVVDRSGRLVGVLRHAAMRSGIHRLLETRANLEAAGDPLELANLWYRSLAGTLNAALAHGETESDLERTG